LLDTFNREIDTIRISITSSCNLKCFYCAPSEESIINSSPAVSSDKILTFIHEAALLGIKRVKFTGGEPLLRADLYYLLSETKKIKGITDISLTTNGVLLADMAFQLKNAGLDRINVSLDSLNSEKYRKITGFDSLQSVIDGIHTAISAKLVPLKINTVLIDGVNNDEIKKIKEFASSLNVGHQTINMMNLKENKELSENCDTEKPPVCAQCSRIRLSADGKLLPCLFSDVVVDPEQFETYSEAIHECIIKKPFKGFKAIDRVMKDIGG